MLHRCYKQIRTASNKNLISIEISMLQAVNRKDKSDIPEYLQYQDHGLMYSLTRFLYHLYSNWTQI